jgi:hypothetical protein
VSARTAATAGETLGDARPALGAVAAPIAVGGRSTGGGGCVDVAAGVAGTRGLPGNITGVSMKTMTISNIGKNNRVFMDALLVGDGVVTPAVERMTA